MRWNNALSDPDELSEVVQFLGYKDSGELFKDYLFEKQLPINELPRYVDDILIQKQQAAAAAAIETLEKAEVNGIPLFHFREGTLESMVTSLIGLNNGRTVENSKMLAERAKRRTLMGFKLNGVHFDVGSFSEMLLLTVRQLLLLPDAVSKLNAVNGAISTDKTKLNPNGKIVPVGELFVDVKKSADQLEDLAMKCAAKFGQTFEVKT